MTSLSVEPSTIAAGGTAIITVSFNRDAPVQSVSSSLGDAIVRIGPRFEYRSTNGPGVATITATGYNRCEGTGIATDTAGLVITP